MINIPDAINVIRTHQTKIPIKFSPIAEDLGLDIYNVSGWPNNISGKLQKDKKSKSGFTIYVNAEHPDVRRRFTIAHEIAHFVLHRYLIEGDELVDNVFYRSGLSNAAEYDANNFAADILMPWHLMSEYMTPSVRPIEELAKIFNVSKHAMSIRLGVPYES